MANSDITVYLTSAPDLDSTASQPAPVKAISPTPRETYAFKYEDLDRLFSFADANGLTDELFHIVVAKWNLSRMH